MPSHFLSIMPKRIRKDLDACTCALFIMWKNMLESNKIIKNLYIVKSSVTIWSHRIVARNKITSVFFFLSQLNYVILYKNRGQTRTFPTFTEKVIDVRFIFMICHSINYVRAIFKDVLKESIKAQDSLYIKKIIRGANTLSLENKQIIMLINNEVLEVYMGYI
ncbi:hypothetical protein ACJX0J_013048, partial [Zea mays]